MSVNPSTFDELANLNSILLLDSGKETLHMGSSTNKFCDEINRIK